MCYQLRGTRATSATSRLSLVYLRRPEDANQALRRQVEEKSDIIGRLQCEIQQLVDRINAMEARHSVELGITLMLLLLVLY